jgi:hypothetical protein
MSFGVYGTSPKAVKLTKADATPITVPRALWVGTAGSANLVDESGNTLTAFPLQAGYNPIRISQLETGGDADDIWGLY